jgi:hypothetical protein
VKAGGGVRKVKAGGGVRRVKAGGELSCAARQPASARSVSCRQW